jgi:hypothetical protein
MWFYFDTAEEYQTKYDEKYRLHGTEEYEIQFIDGDDAESELAKVVGLNQCNFKLFMDLMERGLSDRQLAGVYERLDNQHMSLEDVCALDEDELDEGILHECTSAYSEREAIKDYAEDYIEDCGMLNDMPEELRGYFDYDAYARDLDANGMSAFEFNNIWYVVQ